MSDLSKSFSTSSDIDYVPINPNSYLTDDTTDSHIVDKLPITVVVVSYHTGESLFPMLESLLVEPVSEVIIINNGNDDNVLDRLEILNSKDSRIRIFHKNNIGFAKACNFAVQQVLVEEQVILFLNPDMLVDFGAIKLLYKNFIKFGDLDIVLTGFVKDKFGHEQRGLRRNLLTPLSLFIEMFRIDNIFPQLANKRFNLTQQQYVNGDLIEIPVISGSCMMVDKKFFNKLSGFDEGYFLHVEDIDFCRRVHQQKGKIYLYRAAKFMHYQGTSKTNNSFVEMNKRNGFIRYFKKYHPIIWYSPIGWGLLFFIYLKYWISFRYK